MLTLGRVRLGFLVGGDTKLLGERQIGAVRASLIPAPDVISTASTFGVGHSLDSGTDGADDDSHVQLSSVLPLVQNFAPEGISFLLVQLLEAVKASGVLGNESALLEVGDEVVQSVLGRKFLDIFHEEVFGDVGEGIGDSVAVSLIIITLVGTHLAETLLCMFMEEAVPRRSWS